VEIGALGLDLSVAAADPAFTGAFLPLAAIPTGGATGQVLVKDSATNYDTAWDDPTYSWGYATGSYYGAPTTGGTNAGGNANRIYALQAFFPTPITIDRISIRVSTAGASGSLVRLGVYAPGANGLPGVLLHDFGTIDGTQTGDGNEITVNVTLSGFVWLAARTNSQAPTLRFANVIASYAMPQQSVISANVSGWRSIEQIAGDTLVTPFPAGGPISAPDMRVRAA
jgi:hypothetical protein